MEAEAFEDPAGVAAGTEDGDAVKGGVLGWVGLRREDAAPSEAEVAGAGWVGSGWRGRHGRGREGSRYRAAVFVKASGNGADGRGGSGFGKAAIGLGAPSLAVNADRSTGDGRSGEHLFEPSTERT